MRSFTLGFVGLILCISILFSSAIELPFFDLTERKLFTVSSGTTQILEELDEALNVNYYAPFSHPRISKEMHFHIKRIKILLENYRTKVAPNLIKISYIDTYNNFKVLTRAKRIGLKPVVGHPEAYLWGLSLKYGEKVSVVESFDSRKQGNVEHDITEAILSVIRDKKPKMYVISSLPVLGRHRDPLFKDQREWMIIRSLRKTFEIDGLDLAEPSIPDDADIIMMIGDQGLSDEHMLAVIKFIRSGHPAIMVLDPFCRVCQRDSVEAGSNSNPSPLSKMLQRWGVFYDASLMVGDQARSTRIQSVGKFIDYPFMMKLGKDDISQKVSPTGQLQNIFYSEGGFFRTIQPGISSLEWHPLLWSGAKSGYVDSSLPNLKSAKDLGGEMKISGDKKTLAVLLTGFFPDRDPLPPEAGLPEKSSIFLLGDIDMLQDRNTMTKARIGGRVYLKSKNDNISFVENTAQYLVGNEHLGAIRSHERIFIGNSLVEKVQPLSNQAYEQELKHLGADLERVRSKMSEYNTMSHDRLTNPSIASSMESLREEDILISKKIMELREKFVDPVRNFIFWFELLHIALIPGCIIGFFGIFRWMQRRKILKLIPRHRGLDRRLSDRRG